MGKKNKTINTAMWAIQNPKKAQEMEERFGVEVRKYPGYRADSGESYEEYQASSNWHEDMKQAARNDYDLRRTLEASAMSGKGKAEKILDGGFNNIGDIANAMNFSEKAAVRHGQGGDFNNPSDYMGLTQSMVERDREKQDQGYRKMVDNRFNQFKKDQKETEAEASSNEPVELSDRAKAAKAFGEYGFNPRSTNENESELIFGNAMDEQTSDASMGADNNNSAMAYDPTKGESSAEAGAFLANQKEMYKEGIRQAGITGRGKRSLNF